MSTDIRAVVPMVILGTACQPSAVAEVDQAVSVTTDEWTPATVTLVGPGDGAYTFELAAPPRRGWATVSGNSATYYPEPYFDGEDSFAYNALGDNSTTLMAVSITVKESSSLPDGEGVALTTLIDPTLIEFSEQVYIAEPPKPSGYTLDRAAFCRLFYQADIDGTEGLWLAASVKSEDPVYGDGWFMVQGLDLNLLPIAGSEKVLTDDDGTEIKASGDSNNVTDGQFYYAAAGGCGNASCSGSGGHSTIQQFDRNWDFVAQGTFDFDNEDYRSNDMLFRYANRQLFYSLSYSENCGDSPNEDCAGGDICGHRRTAAAFFTRVG